jgi:thiosulfate/3-mercaptopyruvate sulfurtransferase
MLKLTHKLLPLGLLALPLFSSCGTNAMAAEVTLETAAVKLARETVEGQYGLITAAELKQKIDAGKAPILIDAMPLESSFNKGHLPGALQFLFPIPDMDSWDATLTEGKSQADFEALLGADKGAEVVVYCGFVKCTRSHNAALWALKAGFTNVKRFPGGVNAWKGAGYALSTE